MKEDVCTQLGPKNLEVASKSPADRPRSGTDFFSNDACALKYFKDTYLLSVALKRIKQMLVVRMCRNTNRFVLKMLYQKAMLPYKDPGP